MLKRDENKFCWYIDGRVGLPKDSIEEAIQDYLEEAKENGYSLDSVGIVNPLFLIHELSAKRAIEDVINFSLPRFMYDISSDYIAQDQLCIIKEVHIEELANELSKVYNDWEKRYGYNNQSYLIFTDEVKNYYIADYIK